MATERVPGTLIAVAAVAGTVCHAHPASTTGKLAPQRQRRSAIPGQIATFSPRPCGHPEGIGEPPIASLVGSAPGGGPGGVGPADAAPAPRRTWTHRSLDPGRRWRTRPRRRRGPGLDRKPRGGRTRPAGMEMAARKLAVPMPATPRVNHDWPAAPRSGASAFLVGTLHGAAHRSAFM